MTATHESALHHARQAVEAFDKAVAGRDFNSSNALPASTVALFDEACRLSVAAVRAIADGWRPISEAPMNRKVLVGYTNPLGNWRTVIACNYTAGTLELADDADETEDGYAEPGWYEEHENVEFIRFTDQEPTHWMPLPPPPKDSP